IEYQDDKGIDRAHGRLGATYIGAVDLKDIVSIDGVDVADKPEKARALLLQRMGREVAVGMKAVDDEPEVFSLRGLPEFNTPLSDPEHESHHLFFSKNTDQRLYIRFSPVEAAVQAVKQ